MPKIDKVSKWLGKVDPKWGTREFLFKKAPMFGFIVLGMMVAYPLQLFAPLSRDGWLFFQQSLGFGFFYAGLKAFMIVTFCSWWMDGLNHTKKTMNSDKYLFLVSSVFFVFIFWIISSRGWENPVLMLSSYAATAIIVVFMNPQNFDNDSNGDGSGKGDPSKLQHVLKKSEFIVR